MKFDLHRQQLCKTISAWSWLASKLLLESESVLAGQLLHFCNCVGFSEEHDVHVCLKALRLMKECVHAGVSLKTASYSHLCVNVHVRFSYLIFPLKVHVMVSMETVIRGFGQPIRCQQGKKAVGMWNAADRGGRGSVWKFQLKHFKERPAKQHIYLTKTESEKD